MSDGSSVPKDATLSKELRKFLDAVDRKANQSPAVATAALNLFTDVLQGVVPASGGNTTDFLRADGNWAEPPAGCILQCLQTTYTANTDLTTAIPFDDTIPLVSEGAEVLSLAITPSSVSSKILCNVSLCGGGNTQPCGMALFRGTTCIIAVPWVFVGAGFAESGGLVYLDSPANIAAQTYSVRVGTSTGAVVRLNGHNTARLFGGAAACTLTLMEIAG